MAILVVRAPRVERELGVQGVARERLVQQARIRSGVGGLALDPGLRRMQHELIALAEMGSLVDGAGQVLASLDRVLPELGQRIAQVGDRQSGVELGGAREVIRRPVPVAQLREAALVGVDGLGARRRGSRQICDRRGCRWGRRDGV
jgi:hypothetical protein